MGKPQVQALPEQTRNNQAISNVMPQAEGKGFLQGMKSFP
jgi:hypothetical protein